MKGNGQSVQELIRLEAYLLSERAGHPHGMQQAFWAQAEGIILGRSHKTKPAKKPAATSKAAAPAVKKPAKKTATAKTEKQLPLVPEISVTAKKATTKDKTAPTAKAAPKPTKAPAKSGGPKR